MSTIMTILMVLLLTIVILGILWVFMKGYVKKQSELIKEKKGFFSEDVKILSIKVNDGNLSINLRNNGGEIVEKKEEQIQIPKTVEADVISVVDLSGSMRSCNNVYPWYCCYFALYGDYGNGNCYGVELDKKDDCTSYCGGEWVDRLTPTQNANKELINTLFETEGNRMGLVGYSSDIKESASLNLTDNVEDLNTTINSWEAQGGTCLCCGINEAAAKLKQQSAPGKTKTMIIMSDGDANLRCAEQNTGDAEQDAIQAACDVNNTLSNLTIYSIGVGDSVNEDLLKNVSECGGGEYFSATNISDLVKIYGQVANKIKKTYKSISKFNYLLIVFYNKTSSYKERISGIPGPLETKKYDFNLTGKLEGEIQKVEIYPIFVSSSGKEIIGPVFDIWKRD